MGTPGKYQPREEGNKQCTRGGEVVVLVNEVPLLARAVRARCLPLVDYYGMGEIAAILGVQRKRVQRLMRERTIRPHRVTKGKYDGAFAQDLENYLASIEEPAPQPQGNQPQPLTVEPKPAEPSRSLPPTRLARPIDGMLDKEIF